MNARTETIRSVKEQLAGHMKHRLDYTTKELVSRLRNLAFDLDRAAARLERDPADGTAVNSLGEVQGRGGEVDRLCGIRAVLIEDAKCIAAYIELLA